MIRPRACLARHRVILQEPTDSSSLGQAAESAASGGGAVELFRGTTQAVTNSRRQEHVALAGGRVAYAGEMNP